MRTLANILWHFPFFGFANAFVTFLIGGFLVLTVIGAPIGLGLIQLSKSLLKPFSYEMINKKDIDNDQNKLWKSFGLIIRIIYFPFGLFITVLTIIQIAFLFVSIIGAPVALVLAKSLGTFFNPVNKVCVPKAVADELSKRKSEKQVDEYLKKQ